VAAPALHPGGAARPSRRSGRQALPVSLMCGLVVFALLGCQNSPPARESAADPLVCPAPGEWRLLDTPHDPSAEPELSAGARGRVLSTEQALALLSERQPKVILLGEFHDSAEEHRWQAQVLAALLGRFSGLEVGFEMFRASQQPALDAWVANTLSARAFLELTEWAESWGHPSALYLPLLDLARMHGLRVHGLNVDPATLQRIASRGWDEVTPEGSEGISRAAPISAAYREQLEQVLAAHPLPPEVDAGDYADRFVRAQTVWDRAMAQRLAEAANVANGPVVGIVGRGHVVYGHGIPHQLRDLGVDAVWRLLPVRAADDCQSRGPAIADLVFGISDGPREDRQSRLRLGVELDHVANGGEHGETGLRIVGVLSGSLAERAGLQVGDLILTAGGIPVSSRAALLAVLDLQPADLAIALSVERDGEPRLVLLGGSDAGQSTRSTASSRATRP